MKTPLLAGLFTFFAVSLHAQTPGYTAGHGDLGIAYEGGEFLPHWHLDAGAIVGGSPLPAEEEFEPEGLKAVLAATRPSASGSETYLGVPESTLIYVAGPAGFQPFLGLATEELDPGDWIGNISVSLIGWSGPGEFALYKTNDAGTVTTDMFWSTFDPGAANTVGIPPGFHEHYTFGFTTPGTYELTIEWAGTHVLDGAVSQSAAFAFEIVPEPATASLAALGGLLMLGRRRRR